MLKRIHVNRHNINHNKHHPGDPLPTLGVERGSGAPKVYGDSIKVLDKGGDVVLEFIYRPDKPLKCGAKVWVETRARLVVDGNLIE